MILFYKIKLHSRSQIHVCTVQKNGSRVQFIGGRNAFELRQFGMMFFLTSSRFQDHCAAALFTQFYTFWIQNRDDMFWIDEMLAHTRSIVLLCFYEKICFGGITIHTALSVSRFENTIQIQYILTNYRIIQYCVLFKLTA